MKNKLDFILVVLIGWLLFPLVALWIWLTHPGKCVVIWKKEIEGTWWRKNMKSPFKDFNNKDIYEGDVVVHPSGQKGTVIYHKDRELPEDAWCVNYGDGLESRLCLQVGNKGRAVVYS